PARTTLRHVVHGFGVVTTARRGDERCPAVVFLQHRADVSPRARIGQSPLRANEPSNTSAHEAVISIRANSLPRRAVLEANEQLLLSRVLTQLSRESLINPSPACVRVNCRPYGLTGLCVLGQTMPVWSRSLERCHRSTVQHYIILARPP